MKAKDSPLNVYFEPWMQAEVVREYCLPFRMFPMEQGSQAKHRSRDYKQDIRKACKEACELKALNKDIWVGLRIVFCGARRGDQTNCIKLVEDALSKAAYDDDRQVDYTQVVRGIDRAKGDEVMFIEILRQ